MKVRISTSGKFFVQFVNSIEVPHPHGGASYNNVNLYCEITAAGKKWLSENPEVDWRASVNDHGTTTAEWFAHQYTKKSYIVKGRDWTKRIPIPGSRLTDFQAPDKVKTKLLSRIVKIKAYKVKMGWLAKASNGEDINALLGFNEKFPAISRDEIYQKCEALWPWNSKWHGRRVDGGYVIDPT